MTIQSAIYLTGNKRKLYEQIEPFLKGKDTLVDLFTGSGTIALNAVNSGICKNVYANDSLKPLMDLHTALALGGKNFIKEAKGINKKYPSTKDGFLQIREAYNKKASSALLLNLQYRSNSNMLRFNKSGKFNMTYGERNRFDEDRLEQHCDLCRGITFYNMDFLQCISHLQQQLEPSDTVVYIDSPYTGTTATYNEQGGWSEEEDRRLLMIVSLLQYEGFKIVMSNVFSNRGYDNIFLQEWCARHKDNFDVHHLSRDYANSSFRKSPHKTDEVLIVSKDVLK